MTETFDPEAVLAAADPVFDAVVPAAEALALSGRTLLHAGPPFAEASDPPAPMRNSLVAAILHEGWAGDASAAAALLDGGAVALVPAADKSVATPLALIVSPSTWLQRVTERRSGAVAWAPINDGPPDGGALRFGAPTRLAQDRLATLRDTVGPALAASMRSEPLPLVPIAVAGLAAGDELHSEISGANKALLAALEPRFAAAPEARAYLAGCAQLALNLWMAACRAMTNALAGRTARPIVIAAGGNGREIGIKLADAPDRWTTVPAAVPAGPLLRPELAGRAVLPAIGDSALVDLIGFGAQAVANSPALEERLRPFRPAGFAPGPNPAFIARHAGFTRCGLSLGLDAALMASGVGRPVALDIAMLDAAGEVGLLGRGSCAVPAALFGGQS